MAWPSKDKYLTWKRVEQLKKYFLVSIANKSVPSERINDSIPVLILFYYKESITVSLAELSKENELYQKFRERVKSESFCCQVLPDYKFLGTG